MRAIRRMQFKSGEIVLFSVGHYSDYGRVALIRCLCDIDLSIEAIPFAAQQRKLRERAVSPMLAALIATGKAEELAIEEVHNDEITEALGALRLDVDPQ